MFYKTIAITLYFTFNSIPSTGTLILTKAIGSNSDKKQTAYRRLSTNAQFLFFRRIFHRHCINVNYANIKKTNSDTNLLLHPQRHRGVRFCWAARPGQAARSRCWCLCSSNIKYFPFFRISSTSKTMAGVESLLPTTPKWQRKIRSAKQRKSANELLQPLLWAGEAGRSKESHKCHVLDGTNPSSACNINDRRRTVASVAVGAAFERSGTAEGRRAWNNTAKPNFGLHHRANLTGCIAGCKRLQHVGYAWEIFKAARKTIIKCRRYCFSTGSGWIYFPHLTH